MCRLFAFISSSTTFVFLFFFPSSLLDLFPPILSLNHLSPLLSPR